MFAEMTPGSNHTVSGSRKGFERNVRAPYERQKRRPEKSFSGSQTTDQKNPKSPSLRSYLKLSVKERMRMEPREPHKDPYAELTEGRLKELASKWFIETQVPLIVHNGFFPAWFLGFITRKDAEEILREKELGCFLVRLSDKTIGYILSYKGRDRCRHFVINQNDKGQFVVCGDTEGHDSVPQLIEYYKTSPFEPFGEYLTSSCFEVTDDELYDTVTMSPKDKHVAANRAVRNVRKQNNLASEQPRTQPPKNHSTEDAPPLPWRSRPHDSGLLYDQDRVLYAQLRKQTPTSHHHLPADNPVRSTRSTTLDQCVGRRSPPSRPCSLFSEISLLDMEHNHRLSLPPHTPPRLSPKPIRQAPSGLLRSEKAESCSTLSSLDYMDDGPVYHLAGSPHTAPPETLYQSSDSLYAEVADEALFSRFSHDNTYEQIPGHEVALQPKPTSSTYKPLEDVKPKAVKNDKWKWFFPEVKRKR